MSGSKRIRDDPAKVAQGTTSVLGEKKVREDRQNKGPVCNECGKSGTVNDSLLSFPARAGKPGFFVHESCGKRSRSKTVALKQKMKADILKLVENSFAQSRQAMAGNGKTYCAPGEVKDFLTTALTNYSTVDLADTATATVIDASVPLEGIPVATFTEEEIESFPVAYAYHDDDPVSRENAKIATLDYEVQQRRLKRSSNAESRAASEDKLNANKTSRKSTVPKNGHPTLGEKDAHIDPEPAADFPAGWVSRKVPRTNQTHAKYDVRYYSPKQQYSFRSKKQAQKFLELLEDSNGDELLAIEKYY